MKKYYLKTFWCAMNQADSEKISMIMFQSGFSLTKIWKKADLIILNTCSVRQKWEDRVFWFLEEVAKENKKRNNFQEYFNSKTKLQKNSNKWNIIKINSVMIRTAITWCMVKKTWLNKKYLWDYKRDRNNAKRINLLKNSDEIFNDDDKLFPRTKWKLDIVFRIDDIRYLPHILTHIFSEKIWQEHKFDDYLKIKQLRENPASANIIIQTWCDNYCSFCIVPYTRWTEKSRNIEDIVFEAKEAVRNWAKEIVLVGQNVNSYGKQFVSRKFWNKKRNNWNIEARWKYLEKIPFKSPFRQLLEELDKIKGLDRIRFTSSNPHDMTKDILDAHFDLKKTCNYLHFALQSGNNEVLKKMNRKHSYEDFEKMVKYLRSKDNFFSISTDIIVWFSWETEKMFEDTLKAFEECEFDFSYNARYSVREWTIASKTYPDDISENEKAKRWHILNDKLLETITKRNKMVLGKVEEILVYWKKGGYFYWRTRNFKEIFFKWENINVGDLVKVKIEELDKYVLKGKLV